MFEELLDRLGLGDHNCGAFNGEWSCSSMGRGDTVESRNPANGSVISRVGVAGRDDYDRTVETCQRSFEQWRRVPAPSRGELVRRIGNALRHHKDDLGLLVTLETGKILSEGKGEVQEMIDMCDFSVGLSRQLHGLTIASERPDHRMMEQWHPIGPVGIITAFNFPVAVWAWNAAVAAVCGDAMLWKPSPLAPLTAIAVQNIVNQVVDDYAAPPIFGLCVDNGATAGQWIAQDTRFPLVSATGSCSMGQSVASVVGARLGRSLLELGGNNAAIVTESANLDLAVRGIVFAAVGTAGQRCTTLRRLIVHRSIADQLIERLLDVYPSIKIGDPWNEDILMGPLVTEDAVDRMFRALARIKEEGGEVLYGGKRLERPGNFVMPTIVAANSDMSIVDEETFAPILYILRYDSLEDAISLQNRVPQGLSSAIFTQSVSESELFLAPEGSDCGIANVNIGTSGAEIGGAFGGEKQTGGGREAGSDAWKAYMRRQTCTINRSSELPLAQGVQFDV